LHEKPTGPSDGRETEAFARRRPGKQPEGSNTRRQRLRRQKTEERRRRRTAVFMQEYLAYLHRLLHPSPEEAN
jgi:hypothetical protein